MVRAGLTSLTRNLCFTGSVLVIGGENGSNGYPIPNLEILPKPEGGDTVLEMEWLLRTDPNNLYPFMFVLPGGGIFVIYYNEVSSAPNFIAFLIIG